MTDLAVDEEEYILPTRVQAERVAWGVLLVAFAIFCVICAASTIGIHWFFFQSTVQLSVESVNGSGIVGIRIGNGGEQNVRGHRELADGVTIQTDTTNALSQATIFFRDTRQGNGLIATVTLKGNTTLRLDAASRPRFDWDLFGYRIDLSQVRGELDVVVMNDLERDIAFNITTDQNVLIRLGDGGEYNIASSDTQTTLANYRGEAVLFSSLGFQFNRSIPMGQRGYINNDATEIELRPVFTDLIQNGTLEVPVVDTGSNGASTNLQLSSLQIPLNWSCGNSTDNENDPRGGYGAAISPDGRPALRMIRGNTVTSHGETFCEQGLNDVDVRGYNFLEVRATLYVDNQSLAACGQQGSECPMMFQIDYVGADATESDTVRSWRQGVYVTPDPSGDWPLACDTCFRAHVRIYEDAWYTFESGNLFTIIPAEQRPVSIKRIRIYASGHQYDVYVRDVSLVVGNTVTTPGDNG